jgi:hypothetical protein
MECTSFADNTFDSLHSSDFAMLPLSSQGNCRWLELLNNTGEVIFLVFDRSTCLVIAFDNIVNDGQ